MDTELAALNRSVLIIEVAIAVVIVALLVGIILTTRRRKKASAPAPPAEPTNYYADLQQQPSGRPDPFGRFAAAPTQTANGTPSSPSATAPVFGASGSASFPAEPTASGGLDLGASTGGAFAGGGYPPAEQAQGAGPPWPSDTWSAGPAPSFHADAALALDAQPAAAPVAVAPPPGTPSPPPGTPAGWLPDPNGASDTLRYWDGNAWTQHFAQRS